MVCYHVCIAKCQNLYLDVLNTLQLSLIREFFGATLIEFAIFIAGIRISGLVSQGEGGRLILGCALYGSGYLCNSD